GDGACLVPSVTRSRGNLAVRSAGTHRQPASARAPATARRAALRRAGGAARRQGKGRRLAGGAAGLSPGRARGGVLTVLLPGRDIRLCRGAERVIVILPDSTRMFREAAEAPLAVREQLRRNREAVTRAAQ